MLQPILAANKNWLSDNVQRLDSMRNRPERATVCS
jgi:ArsR family transcriptional regulator